MSERKSDENCIQSSTDDDDGDPFPGFTPIKQDDGLICDNESIPDVELLHCDSCLNSFPLQCTTFDHEVYQLMKKKKCLDDIIWRCQTCRRKKSARMSNFDLFELISELQTRVDKLEAGSIHPNTATIKPVTKNAAQMDFKHDAMSHQVLLAPKENEQLTIKSFADIARKHLSDVPITKIGITKNGQGFIKLPDQSKRDEVFNKLKANFNVTSQTRDLREFLPKITIYGIDSDVYTNSNKEDLKISIMSKNPLITTCVNNGKTFDILFVKKDMSTNSAKAVVKVHQEVLQVIRQSKYRIYVDCGVYRVSDRFFLNQCYRCQQFGHRSETCPKKQSDQHVCRFCASNHKSSTCPLKQSQTSVDFKCSNCGGNHSTTDHRCSVLQKQLDFVLRKTKGMERISKNSIPHQAIIT